MRTLKTNTSRTFAAGQTIRIAGKPYMVDSPYPRPDAHASPQALVEWDDQLRLTLEYMAEVATLPIVVVHTRTETFICYAQ